jgi:hypothetical protein
MSCIKFICIYLYTHFLTCYIRPPIVTALAANINVRMSTLRIEVRTLDYSSNKGISDITKAAGAENRNRL